MESIWKRYTSPLQVHLIVRGDNAPGICQSIVPSALMTTSKDNRSFHVQTPAILCSQLVAACAVDAERVDAAPLRDASPLCGLAGPIACCVAAAQSQRCPAA
jgi:hypothetical protein